MRRRWLFPLILAAAAAAPGVADAHLKSSGVGALYDGALHFVVSPEDMLPAAALGLFAGLRNPATSRTLLATLPIAWFLGGALALGGATTPSVVLAVMTAGLFLAIGLLLATDLAIPRMAAVGVAIALGLVRGLSNLSGVAPSLSHFASLGSIAACVFVVFALAASVTLPLKTAWMVIGVRIGGSWLAASGLLLAGWLLRYGARAA